MGLRVGCRLGLFAAIGWAAGDGGADGCLDGRCPERFRFTHWPHEDSCWRNGRYRECCLLRPQLAQDLGCWNDFFTRDLCCVEEVVHTPVPDEDCVSSAAVPRPSAEDPFVFLWDEKAGGSTFNRWLLESAAHEGVLNATHISDFWWPNLIGTPYFLKFFGEERRRRLAIVSGSFDWRAVESLCLPRAAAQADAEADAEYGGARARERRAVRCFVLLRDPVDRFVSYWLERSDRRLEQGGRRTLGDVPPDELREYLQSIRVDTIKMDVTESGVGCNREVGLCLFSGREAREAEPTETETFRTLRGPQNRLGRMLDPGGGAHPRFAVAARRLERCTVGVIDRAHREDLRAVLAHRAPWIREVLMAETSELHVADIMQVLGSKPVKSYDIGKLVDGIPEVPVGIRDAKRNHWYTSESKWVRRNLTREAKQLLEDFNDVDTPLYHFGIQLFKRQAAEARLHFLRAGQLEEDIRLNLTYLQNHSWAHHFDALGLDITKFMTDGLKCLITSRAMQCAHFLKFAWPDNEDAMVSMEEVASLIRQAYPRAAAYLVD